MCGPKAATLPTCPCVPAALHDRNCVRNLPHQHATLDPLLHPVVHPKFTSFSPEGSLPCPLLTADHTFPNRNQNSPDHDHMLVLPMLGSQHHTHDQDPTQTRMQHVRTANLTPTKCQQPTARAKPAAQVIQNTPAVPPPHKQHSETSLRKDTAHPGWCNSSPTAPPVTTTTLPVLSGHAILGST